MICVVVAHPDDEALSFGAGISLLRDAEAELFLVSLTNASNAVRAAEFRDFAERVGCRYAMLDYPDGGLVDFPRSPEGFDAALLAHDVCLTGDDCVLTHSPAGNERRHRQHVQTWGLMRRWCREKGTAIGFFAEEPLPELRLRSEWLPLADCVQLARSGPDVVALARHIGATLKERPLRWRDLRGRLAFGRWVEPVSHIRYVLRFDVDLERKQRLLSAYGSQVAGLRDYASYVAPHEYLYLLGQEALAALPWQTP